MSRLPLLACALLLVPEPAAAASADARTAASGEVGAQEVSAEGVYTGEGMATVAGGRERGEALLGNLDLTLELRDRERGLTLFGYVLGNHGDEPSLLAGDAQGVSNIEAPDALRLYEAWIEKEFAGPGLSLLGGLYDLNAEFDVIETGGVLLNSSFGIGPDFSQSGLAGPSIFPVTSLAVRAAWRPRPDLHLRTAVLDAVPGDPDDPAATHIRLSSREGALLTAEVAWYPGGGRAAEAAPGSAGRRAGRSSGRPDGSAKVAIGAWSYTGSFPQVADDGRERRPRPGLYALAEVPLLRETDPAQGLSAFGRIGLADPRVHRFGAYTGAGAAYTGLLPGRDGDTAGLGVAVARNGGPFRRARAAEGLPVTRAETVVELTYRWEEDGWAVQPDLQWVNDPDTRPDLEDAWLLGLRVEVGARFSSRGGR